MEVSAQTVRSSTVAQRPSLTPASSRLLQRKCACGGTAPGGECDSCKQQDMLRRQPIGPDAGTYGAVPPSVHEVLRSPGNPLPPASRAFFESGFGHDFAKVRIHSDARASDSARNVNARAYTVGRDIVFGRGEYDPQSSAGRHLLAHELAHVVQQSGAGSAGEGVTRIGDANDAAESHAEHAANLVTAAHRTAALAPVATRAVQRQGLPHQAPSPDPAKMSRAQEVELSKTSVGKITGGLYPPMISFYNFAIDQPTLKPEHHAAIEALAAVIKRAAITKVYIAANGHADSSGDEVENQPLSRHRAIEVQSLLGKLSGKPIDPSWFGATQPVTSNDTVDGRSRNRRVDVFIKVSDGIHHIEDHKKKKKPPPHNCEDDDDCGGWGPWHLPNPCAGLLGNLLCGILACALVPEICLFCAENPEVCFDWPRKIEKPEEEKPENARKACPIFFNVTDPEAIDPYATALLQVPFRMTVVFKQESANLNPYCDCNCGEYRQYVSGYFIESGYYGGPATLREHRIGYGKLMTRDDCLEDGPDPYGHRYKTDLARLVSKDQARPSLKRNTDVDKFVNGKDLPDRGDGCVYKGYDAPGKEYSPQSQEVHFHLKFYGGPYDACNNVKVGTWKKWEVGPVDRVPPSSTPPKTKPGGTYVEPKPAPGKVEGTAPVDYVRLLDQNPQVGDEVKLQVGFDLDGEHFYSLIDVEVIAVGPTDVTVWTLNTEPLNIAPEGHRPVLVRPNYSQTIPR